MRFYLPRSLPLLTFLCVSGCLLVASQSAHGQTSDTQSPASVPKDQSTDDAMKPLFDGKTLDGWEGSEDWFRVEEGAIVGGSLTKAIPNNFFLCTEKSYGDFELQFDVMLRGEGGNAGVQFRSERVPGKNEVSGFQCDVGYAGKQAVWGALYDESRRRVLLATVDQEQSKKIVSDGKWNTLRVVAKGPSIEIFVNGERTAKYMEKDDSIATSGIIGLQIHAGPATEALYRNILIREL